MRSIGFYHADIGYFEGVLHDSDRRSGTEVLQAQKSGTTIVPIRPSKDHQWNGSGWIFVEHVFTENEYVLMAERFMDQVAQIKGYQNRTTLVTYATSLNPIWMEEALQFIAWRDSVYTKLYQLFADKGQPTEEELRQMLSPTPWPIA